MKTITTVYPDPMTKEVAEEQIAAILNRYVADNKVHVVRLVVDPKEIDFTKITDAPGAGVELMVTIQTLDEPKGFGA